MAALKMAALGATPSAATRLNSSSASRQAPAFSAPQISAVYVIALRRWPSLICTPKLQVTRILSVLRPEQASRYPSCVNQNSVGHLGQGAGACDCAACLAPADLWQVVGPALLRP